MKKTIIILWMFMFAGICSAFVIENGSGLPPLSTTIPVTNTAGMIENQAVSENETSDKISAFREAMDAFLEKTKEEFFKQAGRDDIPFYPGMFGAQAEKFFKCPPEVYFQALDYLKSLDQNHGIITQPIPKASATIVTNTEITPERLKQLKDAGYTVLGTRGHFITVEAEITTFLNLATGLQGFDWVEHSFSNQRDPKQERADKIVASLDDLSKAIKAIDEKNGGIQDQNYRDSVVASYFKLPTQLYKKIFNYLMDSRKDPQGAVSKAIPKVSLELMTNTDVTDDCIKQLQDAGYQVKAAFGKFLSVEAEYTTLINIKKGLQNFDWITGVS